MIVRTVELLQKHGFDVSIVIGFKGDDIRKALEGYDVKFYQNPFYRVTNSLGSFWFARESMVEEDTFIMNADVYWDEEILERIIKSPWDITVATDDSRALVGDFCYRVENGVVTMYGKDLTEAQRTTESVGIAFVKASFMPTFKARMEKMIADEEYGTVGHCSVQIYGRLARSRDGCQRSFLGRSRLHRRLQPYRGPCGR